MITHTQVCSLFSAAIDIAPKTSELREQLENYRIEYLASLDKRSALCRISHCIEQGLYEEDWGNEAEPKLEVFPT